MLLTKVNLYGIIRPKGGDCMKKNPNGFWRWYNHILLKIIGGLFLGLFLGETEIYPLVVVALVIDIATIVYAVFILVWFLIGCFTILPNTPTGEAVMRYELKRKKREKKIIEEYGTIDFYDVDN